MAEVKEEGSVIIDWRDKVGHRVPIRNQQKTRACTAFATTGVIEYWKGKENFSVQHLLDLVPLQKVQLHEEKFLKFNIRETIKYVEEHGVCLERSHRMLDWKRQPSECNSQCHKLVFEGLKFDEDDMMITLVERGPFIGRIHATDELCNWRGAHTKNGIFAQRRIEPKTVPLHAIIVVGYGYTCTRDVRTKKKVWTNYFIIHNSWGEDWGYRGCARVRMGNNDGENGFRPIKPLYIPSSMNICGEPYIPKCVVPNLNENEDLGSMGYVYSGAIHGTNIQAFEEQQFGLNQIPNRRWFVQVGQDYNEAPIQLECTSSYLLELSLVECSKLYLAKYILSPSKKPWNSKLGYYMLYRVKELQLDESRVSISGVIGFLLYSTEAPAVDFVNLIEKVEEAGKQNRELRFYNSDSSSKKLMLLLYITDSTYCKDEVPLSTRTFEKGPLAAIHYNDCYLSGNAIKMPQLQLVGVTWMMLAAKYEEVCHQQLEDFCHITDNTYCKDEVLQMESAVLGYLKFEMTSPTTYYFLSGVIGFLLCSMEAPAVDLVNPIEKVEEAAKQNMELEGTITGLILSNK